jgi:hypothetical protein
LLVRCRLVVAWVCGVGLATFGCGSRQSQTISLTNADAGRTVAAAVGDQVEATLQTIGPGQYGDPSVSSRAAVFLGESRVGPPTPGGPTQLFRFEAIAPGRADVTIPHTGDSPEGPAVPAFSVTVQVS